MSGTKMQLVLYVDVPNDKHIKIESVDQIACV